MSVRIRSRHADLGGHFNEDAPRPPVPGMEGDNKMLAPPPLRHHNFYPTKGAIAGGGDSYRGLHDSLSMSSSSGCPVSVATPRRSDLDLGYEPEGSASPTPPYLRWAESLRALLDDEDGTRLFRDFLCQEGCGDLLDFWFACSGFRKLPGAAGNNTDGGAGENGGKRLKLAKAIYRKYMADASVSVAARQIKAGTRASVRDCVARGRLDAALFDLPQAEVQAWMEENTYPLFLKSDLYLKHACEHAGWGGGGRDGAGSRGDRGANSPLTCGAEDTIRSQATANGNGLAVVTSLSLAAAVSAASPAPLLPGYLPTLMEDKEWEREEEEEEDEVGGSAPVGRLTRELLMETAVKRSGRRTTHDTREYRSVRNVTHVNTAHNTHVHLIIDTHLNILLKIHLNI